MERRHDDCSNVASAGIKRNKKIERNMKKTSCAAVAASCIVHKVAFFHGQRLRVHCAAANHKDVANRLVCGCCSQCRRQVGNYVHILLCWDGFFQCIRGSFDGVTTRGTRTRHAHVRRQRDEGIPTPSKDNVSSEFLYRRCAARSSARVEPRPAQGGLLHMAGLTCQHDILSSWQRSEFSRD